MNETGPICTYLIILGTCVFSYLGFKSNSFESKYIFHPESILAWKQYYRLITSGFLHAGWNHLIMNMLTLYWFGAPIEMAFGPANFLIVYFGAIIGGNLLSLYVHRHHEYLAYGASGGVCGLLFAYILVFPHSSIQLFPLPFGFPGWLYAIGFIAFSFFAMKDNNRGNVGHDAHLGGAIVGFLIATGLHPGIATGQPWTFFSVLIPSVIVLVYLWINPLFLPGTVFSGPFRIATRSAPKTKQAPNSAQIDSILEKISKKGMDSLSDDEKRILSETSGQYQRRAQSEKPGSGLAI